MFPMGIPGLPTTPKTPSALTRALASRASPRPALHRRPPPSTWASTSALPLARVVTPDRCPTPPTRRASPAPVRVLSPLSRRRARKWFRSNPRRLTTVGRPWRHGEGLLSQLPPQRGRHRWAQARRPMEPRCSSISQLTRVRRGWLAGARPPRVERHVILDWQSRHTWLRWGQWRRSTATCWACRFRRRRSPSIPRLRGGLAGAS